MTEKESDSEFDPNMMTVESAAKSGIFSFLTHWLMSSTSYQQQQDCIAWVRDMCDTVEATLDPEKKQHN